MGTSEGGEGSGHLITQALEGYREELGFIQQLWFWSTNTPYLQCCFFQGQ